MKRYRLMAALFVVLFFSTSPVGGVLYWVHASEDTYIHALAPQAESDLERQGTALQDAAFRQHDLLPIYGSSELNIADPYHGSTLFANYPTGFTIFPVGKAGTTDLVILQDLSAISSDLRGKKVVISLSAPWFFGAMAGADSYAGNFSSLHANALAFSTDLSFKTKQGAAKRMLQYPKTLENDPLLKYELERLASGTTMDHVVYYALMPLGKLHTFIIRIQDDWNTMAMIHDKTQGKTPLNPEVAKKPAVIDWPSLLAKATQEQEQNATNNPFGFDNQSWTTKFAEQLPKKNSRNDTQFVNSLNQSAEWTDLDLLLQGLREMGAQPLILSMPIQGTYYDYLGVSRQARQVYYNKLEAMGREYNVPVLDFSNHDEDKYFLIDPGAHTSREGWIFYDQAMDAFYHGTLR